jgi:hypothetical protein
MPPDPALSHPPGVPTTEPSPCPERHTFGDDPISHRSECVLTGPHDTHEDARGRWWTVYRSQATAVQPAPLPGTAPETAELVISDIRARAALGRVKYGEPHRADNGRCHLTDLYQELLDGAQYVRAEIERRRTPTLPPDLARLLVEHAEAEADMRVSLADDSPSASTVPFVRWERLAVALAAWARAHLTPEKP